MNAHHHPVLLVGALIAVSLVLNANAGSLQVVNNRIVGGLPANDINIPYIVSLNTYGFHVCGGSIINERTVITAAHCLAFTTARMLKVHAGAKTRSLNEGVLVNVAAIHYNQRWNQDTMDYDIGLVRLEQPLIFGDTIRPIRLPTREDTPLRDGTVAIVSGWGYQSVMGPSSEELRFARVPLINQATCNRLMRGSITDRMLCAGYLAGGVDACQMDSGGPLVAQQTLVGIVSWGIGCAFPNLPGVYTRVSELLPWVNEVMAEKYNEIL